VAYHSRVGLLDLGVGVLDRLRRSVLVPGVDDRIGGPGRSGPLDSGILKRMKEVEKAILQLDESVRGAAFEVMRDFILTGDESVSGKPGGTGGRSKPPAKTEEKSTKSKVVAPVGFNAFIDQFESETPHENAYAIAAHLYREYGDAPFSLDEIRGLAKVGGVTIPARPDMTFLQAKEGTRKLFKRAGKGEFRPTVTGEAFFKETYGVRKGTKSRPEPES
jgi:hypothetical protein